MPRNRSGKYKKDAPRTGAPEHCKVFDVVNAIAIQITDGWMTVDEWEQIYLGVKEKVKYVKECKS